VDLIGQPIPDTLNVPLQNLIGPNSAGAGSIAYGVGLSRTITIPISQAIPLDLGGGVLINATATGTIVATAIVPEPSTSALGDAGLLQSALMMIYGRRKFCIPKN
jgi:hypothetical protein